MLATVAALEGVGMAAAHARDAIDAVLRHPSLRRSAARAASESATIGARASATLANGVEPDVSDPLMQGALRVTAEAPAAAQMWERTPGQVLARLHLLAALDLPVGPTEVGRPRADVDSARFDQLLRLVGTPTEAGGIVLAAIVHGELATLRPFTAGNDIVARAAERIVLLVKGVDRGAVTVPEAGHLALASRYQAALEGYATGQPAGVGHWIRHCAEAYAHGAEIALVNMRAAPQVP